MSEPNNMKDDPRSAPESGEQKESGRNRGQVVAGETQSEEKQRDQGSDSEQHRGSGRHDAAPRSGS